MFTDLFASVVHLDIASNIIVYAVFTILASQLLSYSYGVFADKQVHGYVAAQCAKPRSSRQHPLQAL
jgi:hypothetical protein